MIKKSKEKGWSLKVPDAREKSIGKTWSQTIIVISDSVDTSFWVRKPENTESCMHNVCIIYIAHNPMRPIK